MDQGRHMRVGSAPRRLTGVSLLELLMVLALVALGGTLVATMHGASLDGNLLRGSAKEIAAQLRYTRAQAIASGRTQRFEVDPLRHRWQGPGGRAGRIPQEFAVEFLGAREVQSRPDAGTIVFFEDGGSTGGRIRLRARDLEWQIEVAWLTGEVKLGRRTQEPG